MKITQIWQNGGQRFCNLAHWSDINPLTTGSNVPLVLGPNVRHIILSSWRGLSYPYVHQEVLVATAHTAKGLNMFKRAKGWFHFLKLEILPCRCHRYCWRHDQSNSWTFQSALFWPSQMPVSLSSPFYGHFQTRQMFLGISHEHCLICQQSNNAIILHLQVILLEIKHWPNAALMLGLLHKWWASIKNTASLYCMC